MQLACAVGDQPAKQRHNGLDIDCLVFSSVSVTIEFVFGVSLPPDMTKLAAL